jgi:hypothetical protein
MFLIGAVRSGLSLACNLAQDSIRLASHIANK